MLDLPAGRAGVFPNQFLDAAIAAGVIDAGAFKIPAENVQPASLDLRLGEVAYRIRCSFLPGRYTVDERAKELYLDRLSLHGDGVLLETNRPYLIPLKERLKLPPYLRGKTNPKSSTGRADVFTRVITDRSFRFDEIAAGYEGQLYLEVVPLSFPVRVKEDLSLNQLRLLTGDTRVKDEDLRGLHRTQPLLFSQGQPVRANHMALSDGLYLGLDLRGDQNGRVGYQAQSNAPALDLTRTRMADPKRFWEPVNHDENDRLVLDAKRFYLLMSYEAVSVPPSLAAEMTAYDPTSGELRTHYAGFFDPGFGYDPEGRFMGSTAALEVRAHDVPFMIEHRQRVCKLTFERMLEPPTLLYGQGIGSNYQQQREVLGKHFRPPTDDTPSSTGLAGRLGPLAGQLELLAPDS